MLAMQGRQIGSVIGWISAFLICTACSASATTVPNWKGSEQLSQPTSFFGIDYPSVSPDGQQIAFFGVEQRSGTGRLYVIDLKGRIVVHFESDSLGDYVVAPNWNADGSKLIYSSFGAITILDLATQQANSLGLEALSAAWSPDRHLIAVQQLTNSDSNFSSAIVLLDAQTLQPKQILMEREVTRDVSAALRWSPSGHDLAAEIPAQLSSPADRVNRDIALFSFDSAKPITTVVADSPADEFSPSWSPDGQWLAYLSKSFDSSEQQLVLYSAFNNCHIQGPSSEGVTAAEWMHDPSKLLIVYRQNFYVVNLPDVMGIIDANSESCR